MNNTSPLASIQQSFRIALGAAAALGETILDPQKRQEALVELQENRFDLAQKTQIWAEKGEAAELTARQVLEKVLQPQPIRTNSATSPGGGTTTAADIHQKTEIQALIGEIVLLRTELEQSRPPQL
ncbi:MAG: hypothetical protein HC890_08730 [Chloroflexaceae bacterium]|nr:hypothetical protein [Chloroflexaceae bacterium]